jgi:molybdenum-dependent DNA-binding transcriptional regulator ModE
MRDAHLRGVDLNLLRTIQPLLEERHISRAAKRAFLSQPAMSRALNQLRDTFGDPLLVRSNGADERTPRGERVLREIELAPRGRTPSSREASGGATGYSSAIESQITK